QTVGSCLYELHQVGNNGQERFLGNAFAVSTPDLKYLTTANHVVSNKGAHPIFKAVSHDRTVTLNDLIFNQLGFKDVAVCPLPESLDTLPLGTDEDLVGSSNLITRHSREYGKFQESHLLNLVAVGGIELSRRRGMPIRHNEEFTFDSKGNEITEEIAPAGSSGTAIITEQG
ncbi:MAG: hypothetical protein HQK51_21245, partial [Oligoflexia bacterium]|nr:hypothetical protein [Oligoflexia bacterium]